MNIIHNPENKTFYTECEGYTAYLEYSLNQNTLNILHTVVPAPLSGRGIASALVRHAYDYAMLHHLHIAATCSYAAAWMEKNGISR